MGSTSTSDSYTFGTGTHPYVYILSPPPFVPCFHSMIAPPSSIKTPSTQACGPTPVPARFLDDGRSIFIPSMSEDCRTKGSQQSISFPSLAHGPAPIPFPSTTLRHQKAKHQQACFSLIATTRNFVSYPWAAAEAHGPTPQLLNKSHVPPSTRCFLSCPSERRSPDPGQVSGACLYRRVCALVLVATCYCANPNLFLDLCLSRWAE